MISFFPEFRNCCMFETKFLGGRDLGFVVARDEFLARLDTETSSLGAENGSA